MFRNKLTMMKRHDAREIALKIIYEASFHAPDETSAIYKNALVTLDTADDEYLNKLYFGVTECTDLLDEKIRENAVGWKFERISRISLAIMRIAVYEMMYVRDVPTNAALNEAVELAKVYDDDNAPAFINGILNTIADKEGLKNQ